MVIDRKIVARVKGGDEKTIEKVYNAYYKPVKFVAYGILHSNEDAEEVTQDTFIKAFKKIDSFDTQCKFYNWITAIAKNTAIDRLRRKMNNEIEYLDNIEQVANDDDKSVFGELDAQMQQILTDEEYKIVTCKVYFEFKLKDIAKILDMTLGTVSTKYYRALGKLKKNLKAEDFYD